MKKFEEMSIEELKVAAYDTLALIEQAQIQLKAINQRIAELNKAKPQSLNTSEPSS